jgi:LuxR family transcriptional regulator
MEERTTDACGPVGGERAMDALIGRALEALEPHGFTSLVYDYSPVPLSHDGRLITPNLLRTRNLPDSFSAFWLNDGYYQLDLVQLVAIETFAPFAWSHQGDSGRILDRAWSAAQQPVVRYLRDTRLTCGVTVPIHMPAGELATFTAIRMDPEPHFARDAERQRWDIARIAHAFHEAVVPGFDDKVRTCRHVRLTPRERECLQLCAEGLTAKQIAARLGRSVPTVNLHLESATRRLGARNRTQAVARAAHYRLLEVA